MAGLTTVILAGGQGRRMGGRNKALLPLGNETILEKQLREAKTVADEIIIVANDAAAFNDIVNTNDYVRIVPDLYVGEGPLAGLHAGLAAASSPNVWLLGCDHPYPSGQAARLMLGRMENAKTHAAIPSIGGQLQPLHALYRREVGEIAGRLLQAGTRKMLSLFDRLEWTKIEESIFHEAAISTRFSEDIDTPDQYPK